MTDTQQKEKIPQEEVLLLCDMSREEDKKLAEALEKPHLKLQISNKTGAELARFDNQPTLFRGMSVLQGEKLNRFIEKHC